MFGSTLGYLEKLSSGIRHSPVDLILTCQWSVSAGCKRIIFLLQPRVWAKTRFFKVPYKLSTKQTGLSVFVICPLSSIFCLPVTGKSP